MAEYCTQDLRKYTFFGRFQATVAHHYCLRGSMSLRPLIHSIRVVPYSLYSLPFHTVRTISNKHFSVDRIITFHSYSIRNLHSRLLQPTELIVNMKLILLCLLAAIALEATVAKDFSSFVHVRSSKRKRNESLSNNESRGTPLEAPKPNLWVDLWDAENELQRILQEASMTSMSFMSISPTPPSPSPPTPEIETTPAPMDPSPVAEPTMAPMDPSPVTAPTLPMPTPLSDEPSLVPSEPVDGVPTSMPLDEIETSAPVAPLPTTEVPTSAPAAEIETSPPSEVTPQPVASPTTDLPTGVPMALIETQPPSDITSDVPSDIPSEIPLTDSTELPTSQPVV
jgi:hypothetical protein